MKISAFSPSLQEYELNLAYYHGKDLVHQGCLLKLNPEYSWEKINGKTRNKIRKAQKLNAEIRRVKGTKEEIEQFRTIWFDPEDDTLPPELEEDEVMYMTYLDGELVGGLILTPSSPTVLYMHNLGSNDAGKHQNIPGLTLWYAVEDLKDSKWEYIDVGVSFRPTLYTFFKNWQTDSYPITFSPPFIKPDIRLTPFIASDIPVYTQDAPAESRKIVAEYFGDNYTILPRASHCLVALLKYLKLTAADNVAVYKTFEDDSINPQVREIITSQCRLTRMIDDKTKAVVVIHEYGYPYADTLTLKKECEKRGIPLIEDCAWGYGSRIDETHVIGEAGDYAIYSLPKFTALPYGGILKGLAIDDEDNWDNYRMLDYFKRELILVKLQEYLPSLEAANAIRRTNWQRMAELFTQDGFEIAMTVDDGVYPGAFLVRLPDTRQVQNRYTEFGIQTECHDSMILALPTHQALTANQIDYIYGVFRGKLNLSSNYQRGGKKQ